MMNRVEGWSSYLEGAMKSPGFHNTLWLGSSSVVNGLLGALSSALFARCLGLSDFGTLTLVLTMMSLMTDLGDLGMTGTFVRFGTQSVAAGDMPKFHRIVVIFTRFKLLLGTLVLASAFVFFEPIVRYAFSHVDSQITTYFLLSLVAVAVGIAASPFYPIFQSFGNFRTYSLISVARSLSKFVLILGLVNLVSLCSVTVGIWIEIGTVCLFLGLSYAFSPVKSFSVSSPDKQLQRNFVSFNKWLSLYQIIALISGRLDMFLVGGLADARALGLYGAASKVSALVITVTNSYYAVLLSDMSSSLSREALMGRRRDARVVVTLLSASFILLAALASPIIRLLFGDHFLDSAMVLQIMCVGLVFTVIAYPTNATLFVLNHSAAFPIIGAVAATGTIVGNIILIPRFGPLGAATSFSVGAFLAWVTALVYYLVIRRTSAQPPLISG